MNLSRRYLQFNDLVIDGYKMLSDADLSGGFKTETQEYSHGHGSYAPFRSSQYSTEQEVSMTLNLNTKKLSCEQREYYKDFVNLSLSRIGRLWAIDGKQLLWAWAFVQDFSEAQSALRNTYAINVNFVIYEGVWHKADPKKTFLKPYDLCNYLDCHDFRIQEPCGLNDCCVCATPAKKECPTCACECEFLSKDDSLCNMRNEMYEELNKFCSKGYKFIYNCEAGKRIWSEDGERICKDDICKPIAAGQFYSDTILDTQGVTVTIDGVMHNPILTINKNSLKIMGDYEGILTILPSGEVYYETRCCEVVKLDVEKTVIPHGSTLGFTVHHGNNGLILDTNNCCDMTCVFVKVDSITI